MRPSRPWATATLCAVAATTLTAATVAPSRLPAEPDSVSVVGAHPLPGPAATVERAATDLVAALGVVELADGTPCPDSQLQVRWDPPADGEFTHGAHTGPVGPAPQPDTVRVNGLVVCGDATFSYAGFEADLTDGGWSVTAVPYLAEEPGHDHHADGHEPDSGSHDGPEPTEGHEPSPPQDGTDAPGRDRPDTTGDAGGGAREPAADVPTGTGGWGPDIEGYAAYDPQRTCQPTSQPGTASLSSWLLGRYPNTSSYGIVRACHVGGRSEHKEGRAFDWRANAHLVGERAAVDDFVDALMATDQWGNRHALARRMGVMYVVWDRQIWSSYRADEGWRPYGGTSPHTDHMHISLSWAGALGQTSFYTGGPSDVLPAPDTSPVAAPPPAGPDPAADDGGEGSPAGGGHDGHRDRPPAVRPPDRPDRGHTDGADDSHRDGEGDGPPPDGSNDAGRDAPVPDDTGDRDRQVEERRRRPADQQRRREQERQRQERHEAQRRRAQEQEERRRQSEERRQADEERRRQAEEDRRADQRREHEQRQREQEDRRRREHEQRRQERDQRRHERDQRRPGPPDGKGRPGRP